MKLKSPREMNAPDGYPLEEFCPEFHRLQRKIAEERRADAEKAREFCRRLEEAMKLRAKNSQ